jgi:hypothetical protein
MRKLHEIAAEIRKEWQPKVHPWAEPYVSAMEQMESATQDYGCDPGSEVVLYFLSNATMWRGEAARRIKAELKAMVER